jgi:aminoglycoside 6'-N-acetyltransferase
MPTRQPSHATIGLREATPADVPLLEEWDALPHVQAATGLGDQDSPDLAELVDGAAPGWQHFIAELSCPSGDRPVGVIQIVDPSVDPNSHWGALATPRHPTVHIWIGPADLLGQGLGRQMMAAAIARCFANPAVEAILIDPLASNRRAISFYQRLGFQPIGPLLAGPDRCLALRLDRLAGRSGALAPADDMPAPGF